MRGSVFLLAALASSAALAAPEALSPDEIKSVFGQGSPFTATINTKLYTVALKADGTGAMIPKTGTPGRNGSWRLTDSGVCTTWGRDPEQCFTVQRNGGKYEVLLKGKVAAVWSR